MAAWVRSSRCSLPRMLLTWVLTVFSLMTSFSAISRLFSPAAIRRSTSTLALGQLFLRAPAPGWPAGSALAATADISFRAISGCSWTLPR